MLAPLQLGVHTCEAIDKLLHTVRGEREVVSGDERSRDALEALVDHRRPTAESAPGDGRLDRIYAQGSQAGPAEKARAGRAP